MIFCPVSFFFEAMFLFPLYSQEYPRPCFEGCVTVLDDNLIKQGHGEKLSFGEHDAFYKKIGLRIVKPLVHMVIFYGGIIKQLQIFNVTQDGPGADFQLFRQGLRIGIAPGADFVIYPQYAAYPNLFLAVLFVHFIVPLIACSMYPPSSSLRELEINNRAAEPRGMLFLQGICIRV
jgi:hypothetical protein